MFQTRPWSDQGWICQRSGYADQAARLQPPKAKPAESRFIGLSPLAGELQSERRKKGGIYIYICIFEGSLEVKLPTIWTDEKQSREEAERRGRLEERRVEEKE